MTKYCPACGEELIDAAKFCKNCGAEIDNPQKTTNTYQENRRQYIELSDKNYTIAIVVGYVMAILAKKRDYDDLLKSSMAESTNFITDSAKSGYESLIGTGMLSQ